jgi:vancomycin resistance protein YoaR
MRKNAVGYGVLVLVLAATPALGSEVPDSSSADEFPVVLGTYSTTLIGSLPARTDNIRLAAHALDGTVLEPAQVLSFNRRVGQRSAERGYQPAPVILHESRDVQVGGGVCQVASTLFDAALIAGLRTTERHRHSYPVDYIPLAQDATIVWGAKDLKILNCLDQRVRFRVDVLGTTLTVRVEGESPTGKEFDLEAVERSASEAAAGGREIELFRVRREEGEEVARELLVSDVYPPTVQRVPQRSGNE